MHPLAIGALAVLGTAVVYEGSIQVSEHAERYHYWEVARAYCDLVGKPLLRIGIKRSYFEPPNGDITIDIDLKVLDIPGGVHGDERFMPFADKQFGACFNEHTLEHLHTAEDVEMAVNECARVADVAFLLAPSPYSIWANLFNPTHNLRLWMDPRNNRILVRPNKWKTGLGFVYEGDTGGMGLATGQGMIVYEKMPVPAVIIG